MKHSLLSIIMSLGCVCGAFADECMLIEMKNGGQYSFLLADNPVITYENASLVVNGNAATSYSIDGVKEYRFVEDQSSSVVQLSANTLQVVSVDDETIEVRNAKPSDLIVLLSVSGVQECRAKADADGVAAIKLPASKGVYILSVGHNSFKIIRK